MFDENYLRQCGFSFTFSPKMSVITQLATAVLIKRTSKRVKTQFCFDLLTPTKKRKFLVSVKKIRNSRQFLYLLQQSAVYFVEIQFKKKCLCFDAFSHFICVAVTLTLFTSLFLRYIFRFFLSRNSNQRWFTRDENIATL